MARESVTVQVQLGPNKTARPTSTFTDEFIFAYRISVF